MANSSTARKPHGYENNVQEDRARWRRRDHDNIEAIQNLVIAGIAELTGFEMSPKVRQLLSAIQGAHGGGEVVNDEFKRNYLDIGRQLHFTGNETAIRARVRNWINDLLSWQDSCGYQLITIKKGGKIIDYAPNGDPRRECSTFIDHLLPVADQAVQRARKSLTWVKNPGDALAEQVEWALKELPFFAPAPAPEISETDKNTPAPVPLSEYEEKQEKRIIEIVESAVLGVEERGGDGALWARRKLFTKLRSIVDSLERTSGARHSNVSFHDGDAEDSAEVSGSSYLYNNSDAFTHADELTETSLGNKNVTQSKLAIHPKSIKTGEAALHYAALGLPVFPVKRDKSPATKNGFKDATIEEETIKKWWSAHPNVGIGIPTGKASGWLVLDVDPRHGGDASLTALTEQHGDLPHTLRALTGGGGAHLIFTNPESIVIRNSTNKLGAGLDIRGEGGYIVVAPSLHPSGGTYSWVNSLHTVAPPAWLINILQSSGRLTIDTDSNPILRPAPRMGVVFLEGQRNTGLFKVACAIWGKGEARNLADLQDQLIEINAQRCRPPLDSAEVFKMAAHIATAYQWGTHVAEV